MSLRYTEELEQLIVNILLPVYYKHTQKSVLDTDLIKRITYKKKVAALLRPKEISS